MSNLSFIDKKRTPIAIVKSSYSMHVPARVYLLRLVYSKLNETQADIFATERNPEHGSSVSCRLTIIEFHGVRLASTENIVWYRAQIKKTYLYESVYRWAED